MYQRFVAFDIETRSLDNGILLYHRGTGMTHYLCGIITDIFDYIFYSSCPVGVEDLRLVLRESFDNDEVIRMLESLLALHLIENVV